MFKGSKNENQNDDSKIDQIKELYGEDFEENEIENGNVKLDEDLKEEKNEIIINEKKENDIN